jgi:hypothetical protein
MKSTDRQRADFILARLAAGGIRRKDLIAHFGVCRASASNVFTWFQSEYPDAMRYDLTRKMYLPGERLQEYWTAAATAAQ